MTSTPSLRIGKNQIEISLEDGENVGNEMEKKSCRCLPSLDKSSIFRKNDLGYDIQQRVRKILHLWRS
jgi:hypothetical protein